MSKKTGKNKLELITIVLLSHLAPEDKTLLIELLMRSDDNWYSWPSVQRLCQARGIKFEKNFKGADHYLPDLVKVVKKGRRNTYTLDADAIAALQPAAVVIKHTPSTQEDAPSQPGVHNPSSAEDGPAVQEDVPSGAGAYSTKNTSRNKTSDSSRYTTEVVADAPTLDYNLTGVSTSSPLLPLTSSSPSCDDYQPRDRPEGSASALADKGQAVSVVDDIWDDDDEW